MVIVITRAGMARLTPALNVVSIKDLVDVGLLDP